MTLQRANLYNWLNTAAGLLQRSHKVKVRAQNVKGETLMLTLNGWQARIFQHEYDHLQVSHRSFAHTILPCADRGCSPSLLLRIDR